MTNRFKSYTLVAIQLICIGIIAFTGPFVPRSIYYFLMASAGAFLGLWAIVVMGLGRFNITPDPREYSRMVRRGPYKYIRHPMYASVLVITLAWVLDYFTIFRLAIWIVLALDLLLKLRFEERLLVNNHPEYAQYQQNTYRLIPFLF